MTITTQPTFAVLGQAKDCSWHMLDAGIRGLGVALRQAQAWRESVADLPVVVRGDNGVAWCEGEIKDGAVVRIANFDVTYAGVAKRDGSNIVLSSYTAWYEGADGPFVAPEGDAVVLKLDDDATVSIAA